MSDQASIDAITSGPFSMQVADVFSIKRRGTVVTGQVASGVIRVGDPLVIERAAGPQVATSCAGLEMFRKTLDHAAKGDNVGIMLQGVEHDQVSQGDWLRAKPW